MTADIWNDFCYNVNSLTKTNADEMRYEKEFVGCLRQLNWFSSKNELDEQVQVKAGHETKLADIVLYKNGIEQVVIEMKRPCHTFTEDDALQLFSYMRLVPHQVRIGLIVGNDIRVYFGELSSQPQLISVIPIEQDNQDGIALFSYLEKCKFSQEVFQKYCEKICSERIEKQILQKELENIGSDEWRLKVLRFIEKELIEKGISAKFVSGGLDKIEVNLKYQYEIGRLQKFEKSKKTENKVAVSNNKSKDYTKYGFNGSTFGKGKLVLAVIRSYVLSGSRTYAEWNEFFVPAKGCTNPIIKKLSDVTEEEKTNQRYFLQPNDVLTSNDGIQFVVSTQWGKNNIPKFLQWARKQGLTIEEISKIQ